jgi:hypothetical protein
MVGSLSWLKNIRMIGDKAEVMATVLQGEAESVGDNARSKSPVVAVDE